MSVSFSDIEVGDIAVLTKNNGDTSQFTVIRKDEYYIDSVSNRFAMENWDEIKVVAKPVPTTPGTLVRSKRSGIMYVRTSSAWFSLDQDLVAVGLAKATQADFEVLYTPEGEKND